METSDRQEIEELINIYQKRLQGLKKQEATYGLRVDPGVTIEIDGIEAKIKELKAGLEQANYNAVTLTERKFLQAVRLLKSDNDRDRIEAAKLFGQLNDSIAIPLLAECLRQGQKPRVGYRMAIAIGEIGGEQATETLKHLQEQLTGQTDLFTLEGLREALEMVKNS